MKGSPPTLQRLTGRSSTSSHLSQDYDTITVGNAGDYFYGIPLSSVDVSGADVEALVCLGILLILVLAKPAIKPLRGSRVASLAFWAAALAAAYAIRGVALYPLISSVILTRTSYPWLVVVPHCVMAAASYRREKEANSGVGDKRPGGEQQQQPLHYTCSLGAAFFCTGFGGSIVSDVLMGLPATALGHSRIVPCWLLGWVLVWYSPFDVVYRLVTDGSSFAYYFMSACEAVDGVTTPMGRVSRSARELNNKGAAPVLAGVLAGCGGAVVRYGERSLVWGAGGDELRSSRDAIEAAAWKNLWYSLIWWYLAVHRCRIGDYDEGPLLVEHHCNEYGGSDWHRFVMVAAHVAWCLGCDLGLLRGNPFTFLSRYLRNAGFALASKLRCGPPVHRSGSSEGKVDKLD